VIHRVVGFVLLSGISNNDPSSAAPALHRLNPNGLETSDGRSEFRVRKAQIDS
jgi:hypothetical protein